jgi:type IV secretory pathway VirB9-like protein
MVTNLIIATNRRSYHFLLQLRPKKPMTAITFYYPDDIRQLETARQLAKAEAATQAADPSAPATKEASAQ